MFNKRRRSRSLLHIRACLVRQPTASMTDHFVYFTISRHTAFPHGASLHAAHNRAALTLWHVALRHVSMWHVPMLNVPLLEFVSVQSMLNSYYLK